MTTDANKLKSISGPKALALAAHIDAAQPSADLSGGWWELWSCEQTGTPASLARAAGLRESLASEAQRMADNDELFKSYGPMANASGTTLQAAIQAYTACESRLREDPIAELRRIADAVGFDIEAWARRKLAEPDVA